MNDASMAPSLNIRKGLKSGSFAKDLEGEGLFTIPGLDSAC